MGYCCPRPALQSLQKDESDCLVSGPITEPEFRGRVCEWLIVSGTAGSGVLELTVLMCAVMVR